MFPEDSICIARGKQATLLKERREQIQRVQDICRTVQGNATLILSDCQKRPPEESKHLMETMKALENCVIARERIITLSLGIAELEEEAWGK